MDVYVRVHKISFIMIGAADLYLKMATHSLLANGIGHRLYFENKVYYLVFNLS